MSLGLASPSLALAPLSPGGAGDDDDLREQDRYLPIANVSRIMKRILPDSAKIAKDAKECVQECVSEFIAFVTSEGKSCSRNEGNAHTEL